MFAGGCPHGLSGADTLRLCSAASRDAPKGAGAAKTPPFSFT